MTMQGAEPRDAPRHGEATATRVAHAAMPRDGAQWVAAASQTYDDVDVVTLAERLGVPRVVAFDEITSTLDAAHALAADHTPSGTLILADTQTSGRGRNGRAWSSHAGQGIWLTLIERPADKSALDVLSLRIGMHAARALDPFTAEPIRLKWPNDLYVDNKKLAGILVEARWRDDALEWIAIGLGVNVVAPSDQPNAAGLDYGTRRVDVLEPLIREIRAAVPLTGLLTNTELDEYNTRDLARGRRCVEPARGYVRGITQNGALLVELADATIRIRTGSLVLE